MFDRSEVHRAIIEDWLREHICKPHAEIGRTGAICPFVEPAMRANCLHIELIYPDEDISLEKMISTLTQYVDCFQDRDYAKNNKMLQALIVAFPDLAATRLALIDQAHALSKSQFVERGFMLGQFHQQCPERAVRNSDFLVSLAPMPLFAIRWMAIHDIVFLHQRREWFDAYYQRFARKYASGVRIDPLFQDLFQRAIEWYGYNH